MYTQYYNILKGLIDQGNLGIAKIDWFNKQYDSNFNDDAAEGFPACYIEFVNPILWTEESEDVEYADARIIFHLLTHNLGDEPNDCMTISKAFKNHLKGKNKLVFPYPLLGEFSFVSSAYVPNGNLKIMKLTFSTVLFDQSPNQYTEETNASYEIEKL